MPRRWHRCRSSSPWPPTRSLPSTPGDGSGGEKTGHDEGFDPHFTAPESEVEFDYLAYVKDDAAAEQPPLGLKKDPLWQFHSSPPLLNRRRECIPGEQISKFSASGRRDGLREADFERSRRLLNCCPIELSFSTPPTRIPPRPTCRRSTGRPWRRRGTTISLGGNAFCGFCSSADRVRSCSRSSPPSQRIPG